MARILKSVLHFVGHDTVTVSLNQTIIIIIRINKIADSALTKSFVATK